MRDYSASIPWITVALGCAASVAIVRLSARPESVLGFLATGLKAFALGIALFFVGSLLHSLCIDNLGVCRTHGDANLSYALGGFLGVPAYWLILVLGAKTEAERNVKPKNKFMAASAEAVEQYYKSGQATAKCPKCLERIAVNKHAADLRHQYLIISCKCGKCNTNLRQQQSEA